LKKLLRFCPPKMIVAVLTLLAVFGRELDVDLSERRQFRLIARHRDPKRRGTRRRGLWADKDEPKTETGVNMPGGGMTIMDQIRYCRANPDDSRCDALHNNGRRRSETAPRFDICMTITEKVQSTSFMTQAVKLLMQKGKPNGPTIEQLMDDMEEWCQTTDALTDFERNQCSAYTGIVIKYYQIEEGEYLATQMLLAANGSEDERLQGCGVVVNTINKAIEKGTISGIVTKEVQKKKTPWPPAENDPSYEHSLTVAVSENDDMYFKKVGAAAAFMVGTFYYAFEICRDYEVFPLLN